MISNDRPSQGNSSSSGLVPESATNEETLLSGKIQIERKNFTFSLKENPRGRFLRITEEVNGRRETVIIPAPGLEKFKRMLDEMVETSLKTPPRPA